MIHLLIVPLIFCTSVYAALPFVTDNSYIEKPKHVALETFTENWHLPNQAEAQTPSAKLLAQYVSFSYGASENLELTVGNMAGYNFNTKAPALSNTILQIKTPILKSTKDISPDVAFSFGYIPKTGMDQYYDTAENYYAIFASTSKIEKMEINFNIGVKSSFKIPTENLYRTHLGIGIEFPLVTDKYNIVAESYNGAPNSPRDSPGFFRSYQIAIKRIQSDTLSFYFLYGNQPTFAGYREGTDTMLYRKTHWFQFGLRKVFNLS